jgi:hypothetical protein
LRAVTFQHALVIAGQVAGTWRTPQTRSTPSVEVVPLRRLTRSERSGIDEAIKRYSRFLGSPVSVTISP